MHVVSEIALMIVNKMYKRVSDLQSRAGNDSSVDATVSSTQERQLKSEKLSHIVGENEKGYIDMNNSLSP